MKKSIAARIVQLVLSCLRIRTKQTNNHQSIRKSPIKDEFLLDPNITFLNHGSFGTAPKTVHQARQSLLKLQEENVGAWFGGVGNSKYQENLGAVAKFLGAKEENLVFVENATTGINCVIKSLKLTSEDALLVNTHTYGSVVMTCQEAANQFGAKVLTLDVTAPIKSKQDIVDMYDQFLHDNPSVKCAVIDHISCPSATLYPIAELIQVCHKHGVLVYIDGAHAPGQVVSLNLEELGQQGLDFYVGNLHKWSYTCRGCAILWVHPDHQSWVRPAVTSFQKVYPVDDWRSYFVYHGTQDRTPLYTVKTALEFIENHGGKASIVKYNSDLLDQAVVYLVKKWGSSTEKFPLPDDMQSPCLRLVKVPKLTKCKPEELGTILAKHNIVVAMMDVFDSQWFRLSANLYNTLDDYKMLGDVVAALI